MWRTPLKLMSLAVGATLISLALPLAPAWAQGLPPIKVEGSITAVDGDTIALAASDGTTVNVVLAPTTFVATTDTISITDIPVGSFVGTAALPGDAKGLKGLELHVFPEAMKGSGEGHNPWDSGADSTMTNGTLSEVTGTADKTITVTYNGGTQTVVIAEGTPVVSFTPADRAALEVGAKIKVRGDKDNAGNLLAGFIVVGKNGTTPPI